jgi:hypothetical protein
VSDGPILNRKILNGSVMGKYLPNRGKALLTVFDLVAPKTPDNIMHIPHDCKIANAISIDKLFS